MAKPRRIQRKRTKGWRMPPNTVYVGRPSKFGNQFQVWRDDDGCWWVGHRARYYPAATRREAAAKAVDLFTKHQLPILLPLIRQELRGKNVCCWCREDEPCHGDPLLERSNA